MTVGPDDAVMKLAEGFEERSFEQWRELAAAILNKRRPEDQQLTGEQAVERLSTELMDGITVRPLYRGGPDASDLGLPGAMPFTRGNGPRPRLQPWDIRQLVEAGEAQTARRAVMTDLEQGGTSVWLVAGDGYLAPADIAAALSHVMLDLAPVAVTSVTEQQECAEALLTLLEQQEQLARGSNLGLDPLAAAAATGEPADLGGLAPFARRSLALDGVRALVADARVYHDAGGTDVEEIALAAATAVAYVRALEGEGVSASHAFAQVEMRVAATVDQFSTIAKLRALRRVWARVGELASVPDDVRGARIHAVTSARMLTRTDPWVNVLRSTIACFAAAAGGAESITVLPYDTPLGLPDGFSRRLARNTHHLLALESHVATVADPVGGSWYVEQLTEDMAGRAWERLGEIDAAGGVAEILADGSLARDLEESWARRLAGLSDRSIPLTGTSTFPMAGETMLTREPRPGRPAGGLPVHRDGEVFEALRARAAAADEQPTVLLVSPGARRDFGARQMWATNLLGVAGIGVRTAEEVDADGAAAALREHGSRIAVLATSPAVNAELGAEVVGALRAAGAELVLLAGHPRELGEEGAADAAVREGVDVVAVLTDLLDRLGCPQHDPAPNGEGARR